MEEQTLSGASANLVKSNQKTATHKIEGSSLKKSKIRIYLAENLK